MANNWSLNDVDENVLVRLRASLPEKVFDVHAHVYKLSDLNLSADHVLRRRPESASIASWRNGVGAIVARNLTGGLFFPYPAAEADVKACNKYLLAQLNRHPDSRGLLLITPNTTPEELSAYLEVPQIVGFKPYYTFSNRKPVAQADVSDYLPEWALQTANERGLVITLHLVKKQALADPQNEQDIRRIYSQYPNIKLVLAHAGRSFHGPHATRGASALADLHNLWFDASAICEAEPLKAILDSFGPRRLMWGTDYPLSHERGRAVTLGEGFFWIQEDTVRWDNLPETYVHDPALLGIESLRALLSAADDVGLNAGDLQDIFCENAMRLLGLKDEDGEQTQATYRHAKQRIPGGTQLVSKRPERMAPGQWPAYHREARGCEVWDLDGRHYYDLSSMSLGACLLGYRDADVTAAVKRCVNLGSMSSLNPPEEVELADKLCEIHPWADAVRLARSGGEIATIAVRVARATTDRSMVAICGYHGWHDWYLAANLGETDELRGHLLPGLKPLGVPAELRGTVLTFTYNNTQELEDIVSRHGERLAAVIMEPCRHHDPEPGFLQFVRDKTAACGALLIFDEISIGWRLHFGGAHLRYGINPDLAVFAKALGNGHPIGAVIGTKAAMQGALDSFISSTYWTERIGPAAALATLEKMQRIDVPKHVAHIGNRVMQVWQHFGHKHSLPVKTFTSYPCLARLEFDHELSAELQTLYVQEMLRLGFLGSPLLYPALAHTDEIVDRYGEAIDEVFGLLGEALSKDDVGKRLQGPVAESGFRRLL